MIIFTPGAKQNGVLGDEGHKNSLKKKKKEKDGLILTDEEWRDFSGQRSLRKAEEV